MLENQTDEYKKGYEDCIKEVEEALSTSITRNGGARTAPAAWHVMNDLIYFVQKKKLEIKESYKTTHDVMVFIFN